MVIYLRNLLKYRKIYYRFAYKIKTDIKTNKEFTEQDERKLKNFYLKQSKSR